MRSILSSLSTVIQRAGRVLRPTPAAWSGAGNGALAAALLALLAGLFQTWAAPNGLAFFSLLRLLIVAAALPLLGGHLAAWLIDLARKLPYGYRWKAGAVVLILLSITGALSFTGHLLLSLLILTSGSLLGAGIGSLVRARASLTRAQRVMSVVWSVLGMAALALALLWYVGPGARSSSPIHAAALSGSPAARVTLPDPSQPGAYAVKTLTYGSGTDRFRTEFGRAVDWVSAPVDASKLLDGSLNSVSLQLRQGVWGFGFSALPVNGRVWMPDSPDGPFPLVLMVHGNHPFAQFSDPGFAYLGELLASRGFIFVSVDQNFLNGGFTDILESMKNENDARGWLLLQHLRQWQAWNANPASPFFGKVDLNQIAVGGHSRGGEAAAIAAAFNRLPYYPENSAVRLNDHFNIQAVVAIAPIDGQYSPGGRGARLENINYLVIHGSHDADVNSFDGLNQYERARFSEGNHFKAALYIYRANHGQFNSAWGSRDHLDFLGGLINRADLLSEAQQQQIAKVYITAFLEASLRGQEDYRPLFQDARAAGPGWLPDTIYINRYDTSRDVILASFDEDVNLETLTTGEGQISGENLDLWMERRIPTRWGSGDNRVAIVSWKEPPAGYNLAFSLEGLNLSDAGQLIFALSDASDSGQQTAAPGNLRYPSDLTLVMEDSAGQQARVALSSRMLVQPPLEVLPWKTPLLFKPASSEPVLQSYVFPLSDFKATNPDLDLNHLRAVRFIFDRAPRGSVILDDIGFRVSSH